MVSKCSPKAIERPKVAKALSIQLCITAVRIAYLILAHKNPLLLGKTIDALSCEDAHFFVHIDQKSEIAPFLHLRGATVTFLEHRIKVYWGEFSQVRAILALIATALNGPRAYDYFVLLGGSDYPLQHKEYIHTFFEAHRGLEFIDMVRIPSFAARRPSSLMTRFCMESSAPFLKQVTRVVSRFGLLRRDFRKHLGALEPYGGETWWALTREASHYITDFVRKRADVVNFFTHVEVPDETFLHTIIANSPFAKNARRNILYRDWSMGGPHPAMIAEKHVTYFEAAEKVILTDAFGTGEVLFARKFGDDNLALVERIDEMVAKKRASRAEPPAIRRDSKDRAVANDSVQL
jgi:hypothetical protein